MRARTIAIAMTLGVAWPSAVTGYTFPKRQLTFDERTQNSLTMDRAVAGWVSCEIDPVEGESDPPTCEIEIFDANAGGLPFFITDNAVEDECVAIDRRDVVFRRAVGAGQVILRDLDGGETILSSAGVDTSFKACPQISETRVVWQRGGQVVVYDRTLASERVVGANADWMDLSGDYVVWQEGEESAAEIWLLDARTPASLPQRLTDNAISDERPQVQEIASFFGFPPIETRYPSVVWNRIVGLTYEVSAWNGSTTTEITSGSASSQYFPVVTDYQAGLLSIESPLMAWAENSEVHYCVTCDGAPENLLDLPLSDPFLAGDPNTRVEALDGGWMVIWRVYPHPISQFDLGFYEIASETLTPITDDAELDDAAVLGFRSVPPVGPAVVWRRNVDDQSQIFYAPEADGGVLAAALFALGALNAASASRRSGNAARSGGRSRPSQS